MCFIRLDFETFTTAGPTATDDSVACVDSFAVTAVSGSDKSGTKRALDGHLRASRDLERFCQFCVQFITVLQGQGVLS